MPTSIVNDGPGHDTHHSEPGACIARLFREQQAYGKNVDKPAPFEVE